MSYDLAVWEGSTPADDAEALRQFEAFVDAEALLREATVSLPPPTAALKDFVATLSRMYPDSPTGGISVWSAGPPTEDAWGTFVHFALTYAGAEVALPTIAAEAVLRGLICFDPQREEVIHP